MAQEIDKIIKSTTPPKSKDVLWDNGKELLINRNGKWESAGGGAPMINITYANLVKLRNNNKLIAGMQYRITDYVTTTVQINTQSAGHQFDIIVTADDENTLNEVARACLCKEDTYFSEAGAKLEAWQIWYSLDNDEERFAWADAENGKGVIYRMIDEWNNDVPYDFKNILYVETVTFECSQYSVEHTYSKNGDVIDIDSVAYYGYTRTRTAQGPPPPPEVIYITDELPTTSSVLYTISGDIATPYTSATIVSASQKNGGYYTFYIGADASLSNRRCYTNVVLAYYEKSVQKLNNIRFTDFCNNNTLGYGCYDISFGENCCGNSFGVNCHSIVLGHNCYNDKFGNDCYSNTFGVSCNNNSFGNNCSNNSFGNACGNNSFGNSCIYNTCGDDCSYNSFGDYCNNNSFRSRCQNNSCGASCQSNSLDDNCRNNSFGNGCHDVKLDKSTFNKTTSTNSNGEFKTFNLADLADLFNS